MTGAPLDILFLTSRFPAPLLRGDQVRAFHQLRLLGRRHRITLVSFVEEPVPRESLRVVAGFCQAVHTVPLSRPRMLVGALRALAGRRPLQCGLHDLPAMRRTIHQVVEGRRFDVVHVQLARMVPFLPDAAAAVRVVDLVDALSVNMRRRAARDRGPLGWLASLEAARLEPYERETCRQADGVVVGSRLDAGAIGAFPHLTVVTSGVDLDAYPLASDERVPSRVIFSGNLGYFPNVDAARWLARTILPLVRRAVPAATLHLVGARPTAAIRRLGRRDPAIVVTGPVEHLSPHLREAAVAVAPLRAGSGQPLKVLEAMASGTPVVATTWAARSLQAEPERHLLVADSPEGLAHQVVRLLSEPALGRMLAKSARELVEARYTWDASVTQLEAVYRRAMARPDGVSGG